MGAPSATLGSPWFCTVGKALAVLNDFPASARLPGISVGRREDEPPEGITVGIVLPREGNVGGDPGRDSLRDGIFEGVGREVRCVWVPERDLVIGAGSSLTRRLDRNDAAGVPLA